MATSKVGIYRQYFGPVPTGSDGQPLPQSEWPRKRPSSWLVRWYGIEGKRYSKSFDTQVEAQRFAEAKQAEVRGGRADPPPRITLRDFYKEHKVMMAGNLAKTSLKMHLKSIEQLAESVGWDRAIDRISVRDVEKLRAARLATGIAPATANRELRTLRRVLNIAITRGYISPDRHPCTGLPMLKVGSKRPQYVTPQEFELIYRKTDDPLWRALLVTIYTTGLRLREALNLLWSDIDFEKSIVHVTRKSANGFVQAWTPKDHEKRAIPLPEQAIALLATWQALAPEGCPYAFIEHDRWEYYRIAVEAGDWTEGVDLVNNILRRFQTLCRKAGVKEYTIHDLRRSCLTNWAKELPIHVVKELAGHSDIKTTQQFYLSVQQEDLEKAQKVQGKMIANLPPEIPSDKKMTNSGQKRVFPGRQGCQPKEKPL